MWESTELYHYGIKGMHWGVRRYQNEDGTLTEAGKRRERRAYKKEIKAKKKEIRRDRKEAYVNRELLSDDELNKRTNRLRKENEYSEQYGRRYDNKLVSYGKNFVNSKEGKKLLMNPKNLETVKDIAVPIISAVATYAVSKILKEKVGLPAIRV